MGTPTAQTTVEIEQYYERVRAALAGLAPEVREELLEDLPAHLAEVAAELADEAEPDSTASLTDRLGEPEVYARELGAAAGFELDDDTGEAVARQPGLASGLALGARRVAELADRFDVQAARLVGYPRLTELFRAIQPGWWVLRGWVVAEFLCGTHDRASWTGFLPSAGGNRLAGVLLTLVAIICSVWLGRNSARFHRWGRRLSAAVSVLIAGWGILVLAANVGGVAYAYSDPGYVGYSSPLDSVRDVYVYDKDGKLVDQARLFDQNGNPLQVGQGCRDGSVPDAMSAEVWTYPLCPNDPGPFRAGPGPAPTDSPSAPVTTGSDGSASPAPTSAAASPSIKASPSASQTK